MPPELLQPGVLPDALRVPHPYLPTCDCLQCKNRKDGPTCQCKQHFAGPTCDECDDGYIKVRQLCVPLREPTACAPTAFAVTLLLPSTAIEHEGL